MGSWSVYCSISNISITSGNKCVLLPLKRNRGLSYQEYQPATLPIFGTYNDYGGMEDIEHNDNTKFIEEFYGVTIEEFVEFLVDGKHTYERDEASEIRKKFNDVKGIDGLRFMWIDRQVYDHMSVYRDKWHTGYDDFGRPEFMEKFGFTLDKDTVPEGKDNYDPKRFKYVWRKGDVMMYSDGRTLLAPGASYVYHYGKGTPSSIETYFDVPEEFEYITKASKYETWRLKKPTWFMQELGFLLADRYSFSMFDFMDWQEDDERFTEEDIKMSEKIAKRRLKKLDEIGQRYYLDLETFGDEIVKLYNFYDNMHVMSAEFKPYVLYLTPQCGEYRRHQGLLEKFAEINKSYCYDEDEE